MVTMRSSSSEFSSPALRARCEDTGSRGRAENDVPLVEVDIGLLADQVGVATTNTLDLGQGVHDLTLAIDVGVQQKKDVL